VDWLEITVPFSQALTKSQGEETARLNSGSQIENSPQRESGKAAPQSRLWRGLIAGSAKPGIKTPEQKHFDSVRQPPHAVAMVLFP